jgi:hypothetical protein
VAVDNENRSLALRRRTIAVVIVAVAVVFVGAIVLAATVISLAVQSVHPYDGILINVRNDTGWAVQLDCEYTHSPHLAVGQSAAASFEQNIRTGCGVIRLSDHRRIGCVLDPKVKDLRMLAGKTISLSKSLDSKMQCYGE